MGPAARIRVRDALTAALTSRYADESPPESIEAAEYGVVGDGYAAVGRLEGAE